MGLIGSLVLVLGAAWPELKVIKHPIYSTKNWLLASGGLIMFFYAITSYLQGGSLFFIILEILVLVSSVLMILNSSDKIDFIILMVSAIGLTVWSLFLFEGYSTIIFIFGLAGVGLGYAFEMKTLRRSIALTLGSVLIALFSYFEANWVFFWLNLFFAVISGWYVYSCLMKKKHN